MNYIITSYCPFCFPRLLTLFALTERIPLILVSLRSNLLENLNLTLRNATFEDFVTQKAFNRHFTEKSVASLNFQENSRFFPNFFQLSKFSISVRKNSSSEKFGLPNFSREFLLMRENFGGKKLRKMPYVCQNFLTAFQVHTLAISENPFDWCLR